MAKAQKVKAIEFDCPSCGVSCSLDADTGKVKAYAKSKAADSSGDDPNDAAAKAKAAKQKAKDAAATEKRSKKSEDPNGDDPKKKDGPPEGDWDDFSRGKW